MDPVFLAQNNVQHLVIRIRFGDLRHEQLVFFLFCGTTMYYFRKDVWWMLSKKDKISTALGSRCSLCIWKIHCSKKNSYILFENWIWGHANILTLEGQKDNF